MRFLEEKERDIEIYIKTKHRMISSLRDALCPGILSVMQNGMRGATTRRLTFVDWLNQSPAHWNVEPLRRRYQIDLGKMLDGARQTGQYDRPYLRNTDVQWDRVNTEDLPAMDIRPSEHERYTLRNGDLLMCEGGQIGRCAFWQGADGICGYQKALHRLRVRDARMDCPRFLYYMAYYCANTGAFLLDGVEATIPHLPKDRLGAFRFVFPPFSEQLEIAGHLDDLFHSTASAVATIEREVATMEEYRTRLIADAVTGQIDVRRTG